MHEALDKFTTDAAQILRSDGSHEHFGSLACRQGVIADHERKK